MREERRSYLYAHIWWCGDEVCDCTQPVIERFAPNPLDSRFWKQERLWEGTFHTQATLEEASEQVRELEAAAKQYGIELDPKTHTGHKDE